MLITSIELSNYCNLKCTHCPIGMPGVKYPKGHVSEENFVKALQYCGDNVGLSLCGESLLHPRACELIAIAKKYKEMRVAINTNGTLLSEKMCYGLIDTKMDAIEVSIHTEKSLAGYKRLYDTNEASGAGVKLVGNILSCYTDNFKIWVKNVGLEVKHLSDLRLVTMHNWGRDKPSLENEKIRQASCLYILSKSCVMKWDGKIYSCCFDFDGDNYIGEIDDFPTLNHVPHNYKLCASCSASWATQSDPSIWYPITDDVLK